MRNGSLVCSEHKGRGIGFVVDMVVVSVAVAVVVAVAVAVADVVGSGTVLSVDMDWWRSCEMRMGMDMQQQRRLPLQWK